MTATLNVDAWPEIHDALRRGESVTIVVDGEPDWATARSRAVEEVDGRHGYTIEFSNAPASHALDYDEREAELLAALPLVPPAVFRALPETCETCHGSGLVKGAIPDEHPGDLWFDCPDCVGGVPLVEFVTPGPDLSGRPGVHDDWVRLARGTVRLARVVAKPSDTDERPIACPGTASTGQAFVHVFWKPSTVLDHHSQVIPLDVTEPPRGGQFVAVLTPETKP